MLATLEAITWILVGAWLVLTLLALVLVAVELRRISDVLKRRQ